MIDFNCPHCGRGLRVDDQHAGRATACPGCGQNLVVPERIPTPGIRLEAGGSAGGLGSARAAALAPLPPGRFRIAEASCRLWKKGALSTAKADLPVESCGHDGLAALYGTVKRAGTIASAPRRPPWDVGAQLEVALTVGAFAKPLRFVADIVDISPCKEGLGFRIELRIAEADEDVTRRLKMLAERDDLRMRRRTGMFGSTS